MEMEEHDVEFLELDADEEYEKCAEIFSTIKGNIIIHCTLCQLKFKGVEQYGDHFKIHYTSDNEDILSDDNIAEEIIITRYHNEDNDIKIFENGNEVLTPDTVIVQNPLEKVIEIKTNILRRSDHKKRIVKKPNEKTISKNTALNKPKKPIEEPSNVDVDLELPSCDRPILKRSRKPVTSLTDEERKHKCPYCPFASKDKTNLWSHIQRHSNNKPYQCNYCPKNFHTRVELTFHTRYHTGERPFLCTECGRTFVTKEQLKQHMKRHFNQRDYKCTECEKLFFSAQELREHTTVHTKETPYKCEICGNAFTRRKALTAHKKLHENKRSYKCHLCESSFNQSAGLYLHMKTRHHIKKRNSSDDLFEILQS